MKKQASVSLRNAVVLPKRVSTGIPGLDHVLGEDHRSKKSGLCVPSCVLLCGAGGVGKSTLMLQMVKKMKTERLMYINTSASSSEVLNHVIRLGWTEKQINAPVVYEASMLSHVLSYIRDKKPEVVVVDAVNELEVYGRQDDLEMYGRAADRQTNLIDAVEKLSKESMLLGIGMILVFSTNNKEDIASLQHIQRNVSVVIDLKLYQPLNRRELSCSKKNRFGSTDSVSRFSMTGGGLIPITESNTEHDINEPDEPDAASKQVVIRISSRLHSKLQLAVKDRRANNPGQTITQSDVIRTILEKSL